MEKLMLDAIKEIYFTAVNARNTLADGKCIQADRKMQSIITKCTVLIKYIQDNQSVEANNELADKNNAAN